MSTQTPGSGTTRAIADLEDRAVVILKSALDRATIGGTDGEQLLHGIAPDMAGLWAAAVADQDVAVTWLHRHYAGRLEALAARAAA